MQFRDGLGETHTFSIDRPRIVIRAKPAHKPMTSKSWIC